MKIPSILEMLKAGVHFGHQTTRRHPKMDEYIFTKRNGVHIIDLEKTKSKAEETLAEIQKMAQDGKTILFISTKPQAKEIVKEAAISCGMPYLVDRWIGGLITNFSEIKKLIARYNKLKEEQANGELEKYTKKEQIDIAKQLTKMDISLIGLAGLKKLPDALFIPALQREKTAVVEATKMKVPVIGISDTNANPDKAELFIPANDDAINSIKMMVNLVAEAVKDGVAKQEKTIGQNSTK